MHDEFGSFLTTVSVPADGVDVEIGVTDKGLLERVLQKKSVEGAIQHLTHLSLHKRLGSTAQDRAILISDYAESLRDYSEFAIYLACKKFWDSNESDFAPNLGKLSSLVKEIQDALERQLKPPPQQREEKKIMFNEEEWKKIPPHERKAWHWDDCIRDARKMLELARANPTILSVETWEAQLKLRQEQRAEAEGQAVPVAATAPQEADRFCEEG